MVASVLIFTITKQGIWKAVQMTARIALMITGASLLSYTQRRERTGVMVWRRLFGIGEDWSPGT